MPLLICGELIAEPENVALISSKLGYPTSVLLPPLEAPAFFESCHFMTNIGLALKELAKGKGFADFSLVNFNALPEAYVIKHITLPNVMAPVGIVVTAGMVVVMVFTVTNTGAQVQTLRFELGTLQNFISQQQRELTAAKARVTQLEEELKPIEARAVCWMPSSLQ